MVTWLQVRMSVDSPLLFTQGPQFPQEGCLNVMAQCHCLACRTFLVCLRRSALQVLTCNTTAVQFVSGQGGRSPASLRQEALQLWLGSESSASSAASQSQGTSAAPTSRRGSHKWPVKNSVLQNIFDK